MVPALSIRSLCKRYRSPTLGVFAPITVLRDISLDLALGEIAALVGPRGAGKTTLLRCAAGIARATTGRVLWFGTEARLLADTPCCAFVGEGPISPNTLSVEDSLRYHVAMRGRELPPRSGQLQEILERTGLAALRGAKLSRLPPSVLRRVAVAEALSRGAQILLLDETCTSLGPPNGSSFALVLQELAREGRSVLVASRERSVLASLRVRRFTLMGGQLVGSDRSDAPWTAAPARETINPRPP